MDRTRRYSRPTTPRRIRTLRFNRSKVESLLVDPTGRWVIVDSMTSDLEGAEVIDPGPE